MDSTAHTDIAGTHPDSIAVGEITCRILSDGHANYPAELIFHGVDEATVGLALGSRRSSDGTVTSAYHCVLLQTPTETVLVDTGIGRIAEASGDPAGRLLASLAAVGHSPSDIEVVVISHAHPDHIGGLVTDRRPTFPHARHVMSEKEWRFWTSEDSLAAMSEPMAAPARAMLPPLAAAGAIDLIDRDTEILPGVQVVLAPGHTPGHCVVMVASAGQTLAILSDAVLDPLQFTHTDWVSAFDHTPEDTVRTRARLLADASRERHTVLAYHVGTYGTVEAADSGYSWREL